MAIKIRMYNNKWRISIEETWEFENIKEMQKILETIIENKDKYGKLKNETK